jgi:hypothetical protein
MAGSHETLQHLRSKEENIAGWSWKKLRIRLELMKHCNIWEAGRKTEQAGAERNEE